MTAVLVSLSLGICEADSESALDDAVSSSVGTLVVAVDPIGCCCAVVDAWVPDAVRVDVPLRPAVGR